MSVLVVLTLLYTVFGIVLCRRYSQTGAQRQFKKEISVSPTIANNYPSASALVIRSNLALGGSQRHFMLYLRLHELLSLGADHFPLRLLLCS